MINGRVLPWVQDINSDGYPVWSNFSASQRDVFIINYEGNIETSFDITPYNPSNSEDVLNLTNLILSYREVSNNCSDGEVDLWGECYNIEETTNISLNGNPVTGILDLGTIPPQIGELINLDTLSCGFCGFTGSIPPEIGNLTNLTSLNISFSGLTGSIPAEIGNLYNLTNLTLHSNQLTGSIPAEIGNLINLTNLALSHNQFTDSIPAEIGNLINLTNLYLNNHEIWPGELTGPIPPELGNLTNLTRLHIDNQQLTGSIPPEIGNLTNLTRLVLSNNLLIGSIPSEIGNLSNLNMLHLNENYLTGELPSEIYNLSYLNGGYSSGNGPLSWTSGLDVSGNLLTGQISSEIVNLENIVIMDFSENLFTGSIPAEIGSLNYLWGLALDSNQFSGTVPIELWSKLNYMEILDLSYNQLSGIIPDSICPINIPYVTFDLSNNYFCPSYPTCIEEFMGEQDTSNCTLGEYFGPVWYVSNMGSDENGNGSEGSPFATIQKGIQLAIDGDTVIVESGTYSTNNAIYDKNIILGSRYLTTGDTSFISTTIIDGAGEGCPLMVYGDINDSCRVTGFTIQNGTTGCVYGQGGGVYVEGFNPRLDNLIIKNNRSTNFGGGMHIVSSPTIENIMIKNNEADELGGGLYIAGGSSPTMNNIQIIGNTAVHGGGIFISENAQAIMNNTLIVENYQSAENPNNTIFNFDGYGAIETNGSSIQLDRCTIAHNQSTGILLRNGSNLTLSNSIFWFNEPILLDNDILDTIDISYSNIENGFEGLGNISSNPLFCRIDLQDYALATNSPCIGTGQNNSNLGALGVGCEQSNSHWNFSISEPVIQIDGEDNEWNPGESLVIDMEFCNNSETGHMFYPGVVLEADTNLVSISYDHFWFYGMDANSCNTVTYNITADSAIILDTLVAFSAYVEALNCENQPEYCIFGDTTVFHMEIAVQGALSSQDYHIPMELTLRQNHPNPFNPITLIEYDLPNNGFVNMAVYDMMGRLVKTLLNVSKPAGHNQVLWHATNDNNEPVSAGVYIYVIQFGNSIETKKMILLK